MIKNKELFLFGIFTWTVNLLSCQTKEKIFWDFFQERVKSFEDFQIPQTTHEVNIKLQEYCKGLSTGYVMSFGNQQVEKQLFISANGDKSKFDSLLFLVSSAPKFRDFKVIAFNPPSYIAESLDLSNDTIPSSDIYYEIVSDTINQLKLYLFLPLKYTLNEEEIGKGLMEMINEGLGEYDFSRITSIEISQLKENSKIKLRKLSDLRFDSFFFKTPSAKK